MVLKKISLSNTETHIIFILILSLNYIIPYLLFNSITLFYHDTLDHEIVYNHILGQILKSDENQVDLFLGGSLNLYYLRRIFQPYIYIYSIFNTELAYWLVDVLVKLTSYISFFILTKKINKNIFIGCLVACLYASSNLPTHEGFGMAFMPYIIYLSLFKKNLKIKHFLLVIFFGLNSDFIFTFFAIPPIFLVIYFFKKKNNLNFIYLFTFYIISITLANINLFLIYFGDIIIHRTEFVRDSFNFKQTINYFFTNLFKIPNFSFNWSFLKTIPYSIIYFPAIIIAFFYKNNQIRIILITSTIFILTLSMIKYNYISQYINQSNNFLKTLSWDYISQSLLILYALIILFILKNKSIFSKLIFFLSFVSVFLFQINSSIVPFYKSYLININDYQNLYTFSGYYKFYNYDEIKKIVKNERTISIGLDPMVAVYHGIKVLDGYHNLYPLTYKKNFRKIIEPELKKNYDYKQYYDNWGSRVYTSLYFPKDINNFDLNYFEAKKLGAKFVISKYLLISNDLQIIIDECKKNQICLYKIK